MTYTFNKKNEFKKEIEQKLFNLGHKAVQQKKAEMQPNRKAVMETNLDPVDDTELDSDYDDREDKDIDNDGDMDSSDQYLHKKRKAISKAMDK